jgi:hypothetical protein
MFLAPFGNINKTFVLRRLLVTAKENIFEVGMSCRDVQKKKGKAP